MGDDDAAGGELRGGAFELAGDELVRQTVKTVAAQAAGVMLLGQREGIRLEGLALVKRRVEAGSYGRKWVMGPEKAAYRGGC